MKMVTVQQSLMKKQIKVITTMLNKVASTDTNSLHHLVGHKMLLYFSINKLVNHKVYKLQKYSRLFDDLLIFEITQLL